MFNGYTSTTLKGGITILPHTVSNHNKERLANAIQTYFKTVDTDVTIHNYKYHPNLNSCIVISWRRERSLLEDIWDISTKKIKKIYRFTYIIFSGTDGKTYTGPLQIVEYIYTINHVSFNKETWPEQFSILDDFLKQYDEVKMIKFFPISNDDIKNKVIKDYYKYKAMIKENNDKIKSFNRNPTNIKKHTAILIEYCDACKKCLLEYGYSI